jgi:hypothetical protein
VGSHGGVPLERARAIQQGVRVSACVARAGRAYRGCARLIGRRSRAVIVRTSARGSRARECLKARFKCAAFRVRVNSSVPARARRVCPRVRTSGARGYPRAQRAHGERIGRSAPDRSKIWGLRSASFQHHPASCPRLQPRDRASCMHCQSRDRASCLRRVPHLRASWRRVR